MDANQPDVNTTPSVSASGTPAIFGTKIPSTVAFTMGILLFLMPFIDIRCNSISLQQVSGFQLATGFKMKNNSSNNSLLNDIKGDRMDEGITKLVTKTDKKDPNLYALVAMGLGILGLILSFTNAKAAIGGALVSGLASAGTLIGLMADIKSKVKLDMPDFGGGKPGVEDSPGLAMMDKVNIRVDFTPWFYVAIVVFLAAAFFCYKRMQYSKS